MPKHHENTKERKLEKEKRQKEKNTAWSSPFQFFLLSSFLFGFSLFRVFVMYFFLLTSQADCLTIVSDIKSDPVRTAMARTPQDVTDTELSILQALWDRQPATIRQLTDRLYPGGGAAHYATVQKLLDR